jgi:hypothetical protein
MSRNVATPAWFGRLFPTRLLLWLAAVLWTAAAHAAPVWYADVLGIHRIESDTNTVTQHIALRGVVGLALNQKDNTLWALTNDELRKYDAAGATLLAIDLGRRYNRTGYDAKRLLLNAADDSVWVAGSSDAQHFSASGQLLGTLDGSDSIDDIALAQDGSLWLIAGERLAHYSAQGTLIARARLTGEMQRASSLAIDDSNGALWLGAGRRLFQLALALPVQSRFSRTLASEVDALALDTASGNIWVASRAAIMGFSKDGTAIATTELRFYTFQGGPALVFDAASRSLWLGHFLGISRFDADGKFVTTRPALGEVQAISRAPAGITPIVTLVSPANNLLTSNALIPIRVHYDASCFGQPCGYPPSVFATYTITATLNGQPIGASFVFDPASNDAVFTPATRHAEGLNTFTAFVTDGSGRRSQPLTSQFTVDSVAPQFVNVTPADGSVFTTPGITLQGSVDDLTARVSLQNFSGAAVTGADPQATPFSWQIALQPGTNAFRLVTADPAGNTRQLSLTFVYSTLTLAIASPANGATIDADRVTVTGTFTGATTASVTVNGVAATVSGTSFSAADVPLTFGPNTLTVVGVTPQGARDTRSITVNSTAPAITVSTPAPGASVNSDRVLVRGTLRAVANSGVRVNGVVAAVDASGNFFAVVPLTPGTNTLTAQATAPSGASATRIITINATGASPPVVVTAEPTSGMAPLTVAFKVDNTTALDATFTFDGTGPYSVPAGASATLNATYPEGVFTATLVVNGGAPQVFVIEVTSIASIDAMLQAMWRKVVDRLAAGDIEGAVVFFAPGQRDQYREILNDVAPALPAMFASFPAITPTAITDGDAEYFVVVPEAGTRYGYYLYFTRDGDGVWRLHSL